MSDERKAVGTWLGDGNVALNEHGLGRLLKAVVDSEHGECPQIRFVRKHDDAQVPTYATEGSAGCDLYAVEDAFVMDGKTIKVRTGIALEIPFGLWADVRGRSSLALKGVQVVPGTIDSDFRGEISVMMTSNQWDALNPYHVRKGDRIAQLVINRCVYASFTEVEELSDTARGTGGFGSSGR